jgi:phage tail-like protein
MPDSLVRTFRFRVRLEQAAEARSGFAPGFPPTSDTPPGSPLADGAFQECSGLEVDMDVSEYLEGGRNDGVIRRVGRAKYQNIVLKRGMFYAAGGLANDQLWKWLQDIVSGVRPVRRYNGFVEVLDGTLDDVVAARWLFARGLPVKVSGPSLNAKTGEVAIEELHIAHEGLVLKS